MEQPDRRDLTQQHSKILEDPFLLGVAEQIIVAAEKFFMDKRGRIPKKVLEVGSAGGIVAELRQQWVTSDVVPCAGVQCLLEPDAAFPFETRSFDMIFMQDTLHHVANLEFFFSEAGRVLSEEGVIFLKEPSFTPIAQIIFRFFHPEDFSLRRLQVKNSWKDPMRGNQALSWGLLKNPRGMFSFLKDEYEIQNQGNFLGIAFVLSGGSTFTTNFPRKWLLTLHKLETKSKAWLRFCGVGMTLALSKNNSPTRNSA